ncbi:MAG: two pore domain potassium channel family protein [Bacilli bacterium]|nr:two pore domain potassium channel family protein [Bacilli bacterium]
MASKKNFFQDNDTMRVILIIFGAILSTLVLTFDVLAIVEITNGNLDIASRYLLGIFVVLGLSRLISFLRQRTRISFMRFVFLLIFDIILGIVVLFGKDNPYLFSLCGGLFCLSIIVSRTFKLIQDHSLRSIIFNAIIIAIAILLAIGLFIPIGSDDVSNVVLVVCIIVAVSAFIEVFSNTTSSLQFKVLFKIMLRTFALEIILGLLTLMVAASLVFMLYEPMVETFADGLWYSFAIVTTIGFGDIYAVTPLGRVLSAVLGIYGLIVVAVLTSIIVNFYNETAGKKDAEELKEIKNEQKRK